MPYIAHVFSVNVSMDTQPEGLKSDTMDDSADSFCLLYSTYMLHGKSYTYRKCIYKNLEFINLLIFILFLQKE